MPSGKTPRTVYVARIALLSALCTVGSFIPFPSPVGTIAFDSSPGFFAALFLGAYEGALVCGIGHLATSIVHAFPLGLMHIPIAMGMALTGALIGATNRRLGVTPAAVVGVTINTLLFPLAIPFMGWPGVTIIIPFLTVAASLNMVLAVAVYKVLLKAVKA